MQLQQRLPNEITVKISKKNAVYFQPEDNHKTSIAKREKVKMGQVVIPGNFKRRYKRSPYDSGVLFY